MIRVHAVAVRNLKNVAHKIKINLSFYNMQKLFIILGVIFLITGIAWPILKKLHLGHLPGDIVIQKENFSFYFPLATCIIISVILSIIFWIVKK